MLTFLLGAYFGVGAVYAYDTCMNANEVLEMAREEGIEETWLDPFIPYISGMTLFFFWLPAQAYHSYVMAQFEKEESK